MGYETAVTVDTGFVVEAQAEELPERLFGAVKVCQMEMSAATVMDRVDREITGFGVEISPEAERVNNRALDFLFVAIDINEHRKIANCEIAKEAWDILVTCHEGTDVVKQSKRQRLTTEFETIKMQEEETFNQFYSKLIAIVNSCENLDTVDGVGFAGGEEAGEGRAGVGGEEYDDQEEADGEK
ncbi:hypothetical protein RHGRI_007131 [Rhododendron griersonianum]|uniref:Protein ENHANCED DISEASE RESISTANCE 2 C-terminal domain-containing protein n=1 Tax=Rhododendron griersonianum TaxID=479676 RepID=A0AAV6KWF3_9ERIC|nr:hypothetical protein RHGRI_007131 [Rhododendron griersonianum]